MEILYSKLKRRVAYFFWATLYMPKNRLHHMPPVRSVKSSSRTLVYWANPAANIRGERFL